ncbi:carbohydrate porin [Alteromonas lipolytica]|uniref:Uncharacterized protein n=1 Tax=Alteromonas lipolytica TaxID=1856405 RepID=A0A1E8FEI8_9ALTE|nr:carbohydrate porin [Alteromonas lipolytica]OFI34331.1 hypothetical protein BFC17_18260 [Alteromonas lipolytica]GGF82401.1 porin [Alteromonas lipolytica]
MDTPPDLPELYAEVIVDSFANVHGGRKQSEALLYFANLGAHYQFDSGLFLTGELWLTDNQSISDIVGDEQGISSIEASEAGLHIGQLAVGFESQSVSVLLGVYDINYYFDVLESANLFVHSAFGMGSVFGISGPNGPSTYPQPGLTGRVGYRWDNHFLQVAMADGEPGDPLFYYHTASQEEKRINLMLVGEYNYETDNSKIIAGWWGYNDDSVVLENAGTANGKNTGVYLRGEYNFNPGSHSNNFTLFSRIGTGASKFNFFDEFYSVGITMNSDLISIADEQMGLAIAHARTSDKRMPQYGSAETALELTYSLAFHNGFTLQPSLQWIGSPGAAKGASDAIICGLRFSWSAP